MSDRKGGEVVRERMDKVHSLFILQDASWGSMLSVRMDGAKVRG